MFEIGDISVTAIPELELLEPAAVFPGAGAEEVETLARRLPPEFARDGGFVSAIRSWVVRLPGLVVVVDTGAGNGKARPTSPRFDHLDTPFLERLAAAGVAPDDVDLVVCTHLHVDHVGWNTRRVGDRWVPTFARARHVLPGVEVERWRNVPEAEAQAPARMPFVDSVLPLLDRADTMLAEGNETLAPGLSLVPLPGHSPGMMGVRLRSGNAAGLLVADAMHSPAQVWRPDWSSRYCADPEAARRTRLAVLAEAADTGALVMAAHFGGTGGVRISRTGAGFDFTPAPDRVA